jgi:hypothetical protein
VSNLSPQEPVDNFVDKINGHIAVLYHAKIIQNRIRILKP